MTQWDREQRLGRMRLQWLKDDLARQRRSRDQWPKFYIRKKRNDDVSTLRLQDRRED